MASIQVMVVISACVGGNICILLELTGSWAIVRYALEMCVIG